MIFGFSGLAFGLWSLASCQSRLSRRIARRAPSFERRLEKSVDAVSSKSTLFARIILMRQRYRWKREARCQKPALKSVQNMGLRSKRFSKLASGFWHLASSALRGLG